MAGERKLMVRLEETSINHGSGGGRAIQEHRRVDNPFRDTECLSYNVLSALDQSQPDNHG